jgi:hypothetical protein
MGAPEECPYGVTFDSLPPVDRSLLLPTKTSRPGLGDMVASGLSAIGITKARVSALAGGDCGCAKRQEALNALGRKVGIG